MKRTTKGDDGLSALKLLPAAILVLASVLSIEEREVLAYLITRSMKTTNPFEESTTKKKKKCKKFDCGCFDCYTNFWLKWDSSPNRELIHQAIEAFEEHLSNREQLNNRKRRDKSGRKYRVEESIVLGPISYSYCSDKSADMFENESISPISCDFPSDISDSVSDIAEGYEVCEVEEDVPLEMNSKGFAKRVLGDVLGSFHSRLTSFWSPRIRDICL
ncbi:hypothetical protein GIB67_009397 [Kingdonia uniflora]|uniref:Uncharacterized protein n=1 Tax=Kingdonia uniflora TaxID=39325 RepID=A0A7J7N3N9_9MAGN|nr:hypothetical protein GIB67_009397 [Kingdonia uniflora]